MVTVDELLKLTEGYHRTCTIDKPADLSVTFAKGRSWLMKLEKTDVRVWVLIDYRLTGISMPREMNERVRLVSVENVASMFIQFHNEVNKNRRPKEHDFSNICKIDPTAVIGAEGLRFVKVDGKLVRMKHMGNVVIGKDVEIGPLSVIYRGSINSTIIKNGVKIGCNSSVGHNAIIGKNTFLTDKVTIGGSNIVGANCFFGLGSVTREGIKICDNVRVGLSAAVVKDIDEPGTYAGVPAKKIDGWDGGW